ncbi:Uncharacterized protein TCM_004468 [Theobroma cacao]|uniref:Uncharacterized protein n=1 Tax=Theobroma cacao TaxID=3641 RepID=A0A061DPW3_THECC|nr:Uncharacterized protein TCM_004468 [Theobroma cacao]
MQIRKEKDFQRLGFCHRLFNFILSSLIGRGLGRLTWGHPLPQGSSNQGPQDEYARNGVQEPLIGHDEQSGEESVNSKLEDDPDSAIQIRFKLTEELDSGTPVDKLGWSDHVAAKDDKAMEKGNEFTCSPGKKEIPLLNGTLVGTTKPQVHGENEVRIRDKGSTGPNIIISITDSAGQEDKKKKAGNKFPSPKLPTTKQPDVSKPILTGLGLNINEVSETFIQNTRARMSRNVSRMEPEES